MNHINKNKTLNHKTLDLEDTSRVASSSGIPVDMQSSIPLDYKIHEIGNESYQQVSHNIDFYQ